MNEPTPDLQREVLEDHYRSLTDCEPKEDWTLFDLQTAIEEWGMDL